MATAKKKTTAKATPKARAAKRTVKTAFRLVYDTMGGHDLFTYSAAVFTFTGLLGKNAAKGVNRKDLIKFYNSGSVVAHHTANKNMTRKDGRIVLTAKGKAHFMGRYSEDNYAQYVEKAEAAKLAKALKSGKDADLPDEWKGVYPLAAVEISG